LGVSRRGEFENTITNIKKEHLTLVLFLSLTHPLTTGVPDFVFAGPLMAVAAVAQEAGASHMGIPGMIMSGWPCFFLAAGYRHAYISRLSLPVMPLAIS
jgi:hypothetical protein